MITHVCCKHIQARIDFLSARMSRVKALSLIAPQQSQETFEAELVRMQKKIDVLSELLQQQHQTKHHGKFRLIEEA